MLDTLSLPWWASGYLVLLFAFHAVALFDDFKKDIAASVGSLLSLLALNVFVIGYYSPPLAQHFGWLLIPMLLISIFWEFTRSVHDTELAEKELEKEKDLSEGERSFLLNMATALNALLIVPAYVFGVVLCFNMLTGG